ncbi:hypothetical protein [Erythrobacter sp. EC-HK427]|nr:hypothetical protein [Erythrobacter sp. EC-HK427]
MQIRVLIAYILIAFVLLLVGWGIAALLRRRKRQRDLRRGRIGN